MTDQQKWKVQINGGPVQDLETRSGLYILAASSALAMLEYVDNGEDDDIVKVWVPDLVPEYGPYYYRWDGRQMVHDFSTHSW